jgi:hypothetical protein
MSGIIPVRAFPMLGDCGSRLHKHARSISWDAVMVCKPGNPEVPFAIDPDDRRLGAAAAKAWTRRMQRHRRG